MFWKKIFTVYRKHNIKKNHAHEQVLYMVMVTTVLYYNIISKKSKHHFAPKLYQFLLNVISVSLL